MLTVIERIQYATWCIRRLVRNFSRPIDEEDAARQDLLKRFIQADPAAALVLATAILEGELKLRSCDEAEVYRCPFGSVSFFKLETSCRRDDVRDAVALILGCYKMALDGDRVHPSNGSWKKEMYPLIAFSLRTNLLPSDATAYLDHGIGPEVYDRLARGEEVAIIGADSPASADTESSVSTGRDSPAVGFECQ